MKKTKILFILVLGILLLGLGYQVYGKYVLSKTIQIPFTTSWATEVSITTTKDNAQTATINATAEDNSAGVKKYDFYINDELKQTVTTSALTASYSFDYASTFGTTYDTYVVVTDNNNTTSKSNTSTIIDYTVSDKQDMELFRDSVNNGNVYENETIIQTADIDLQGSETNKWIPIGENNVASSFYGTYEGNNYSISGIYIDNDNAWQGLFKNIHANGTVRNVKLENGTIKANDRSAGIAGGNSGLIIGCINSCNIEGDYAGQAGIVGVNNGRIVNCYNIGSVVGNITDGVFEDIGGIASINEENGIIENCYNLGDISVNATNNIYTIGYDAGGIAGENKGIIRNCYNMGNIDVPLIGRVGGITGWNSGGTVYNCYSATTVIRGVDVGGVVGDNTTLTPGTVTNTYYLQGTVAGGIKGADVVGQAEAKTSEEMKTDTFVNLLNNGENNWKIVLGVNSDYPILLWQTDKGRIVTTTTTKNDDKIATINVTAEDNGVEIKKYDFYINDELKQTVTTSALTASYSFDYASTFGTTYDTYVVVTDNNTKIKSNISTIVDYTLSTRQDLEAFRDSVNNGNKYTGETITQTANIDLEGNESNQWTPIGNYKANTSLTFAGVYNGNYKTISNLYINTNDRTNGLFGQNAGCISNLLLENVNFKVSGSSGAVCGLNYGTISNCGSKSGEIIVTAEEARTGGIVGTNIGIIQNCYNSATVKAQEYETESRHIGGIVGFNGDESGPAGTVLNCYNTGAVIGDGYVGGIVGTVYTGSSVSKCYNIANIEGNLAFGSLIGTQHIEEDGNITYNYYLEGTSTVGLGFITATGLLATDTTGRTEAKTSTYMKSNEFVSLLGESNWKIVQGVNSGYPILYWQQDEGGLVSVVTTKNDAQTATINATATDNGAVIKKYDFYINDELKYTATTSDLTASHSFDYASTFGTTYNTYVVVTDNNNATSKSNTSTIIDYTVSDKQDMELFRDSVNNGNTYENETIIQTASIDLEGSETNQWTPIGTVNTPFNGNYEGNGKRISGLYINKENGYLGLFGIMKTGSLDNFVVEGTITVTGGEADTVIGGIISRNLGANIDSCTNKVNIIGVARIGGIAGKNEAGSITNCTNEAKIEVNDMANSKWIGGIAGVGYGQIDSCVNNGNIVGNLAGGIVGISNNGAAIVSNCINNGEIKGNLVGGIQYYSDSTINNCINNASVIVYGVTSETSVRAAGIVSILEGNMEQCVNKGEIKSDWNETNVGHIYIGGIVSEQRDGTKIAECYNEGNISANAKNSDPEIVSATYPGGIVSFSNGGTIINCYNKGNVSAYKLSGTNTNNAGGIICLINSESTSIESCYNIGTVTASRGDGAISYTGGVVGRIQIEGTISNCYYLEGTATGGINGADVEGQAEVRTSTTMKTTEFKDLLGSSKWKIVQGVNSGYPILNWQ